MCLNFISVGAPKRFETGPIHGCWGGGSSANFKGVRRGVGVPDPHVVGPPASQCPIPLHHAPSSDGGA